MVLWILKQFYIFPFNYLFLYKVYFRKKLVPRLWNYIRYQRSTKYKERNNYAAFVFYVCHRDLLFVP